MDYVVNNIIMSPPLRVGTLSDDTRLTSVAYIGPKSITERLGKTKIGTEVAHVTRDSDIIFKVKRSKVKVTRPLWLAVQVTTYFFMDNTMHILRYRPERAAACRPWGGGIVWRPPAQFIRN